MPVRRTIGISLAFMMISAGAVAKTPEESLSQQPSQFQGGKTEKPETRKRKNQASLCEAVPSRGHARRAAHAARRVRQWDAGSRSGDDAGEGPPDAYVGPLHATGRGEIGTAVWYNLVGGHTSSGEILDTVTATAAHRSLPLASYARVTSLDNGRSIVVKINDRGPWSRRFIIDLSPRAADALDVKRTGIAAVVVEPVAAGAAAARDPAPAVAAYQSPEHAALQ